MRKTTEITTLAGTIPTKIVGRIRPDHIQTFIRYALKGCSHGSRPTPGIDAGNCLAYWSPLMGSMGGLTSDEKVHIVNILEGLNFQS